MYLTSNIGQSIQAEPLNEQHWVEMAHWYTWLNVHRNEIALDENGRPTKASIEKLGGPMRLLKESLSRVGPCPRLQEQHGRVLKKVAWGMFDRKALAGFVRAELEGDRPAVASFMEDYIRLFC